MTRALITDPTCRRRPAPAACELIRCVGCNACIAHYHAGTPIRCAVNPVTGRELHLPSTAETGPRRRLVVVGGGPAGLAAAIDAGRSGPRGRSARAHATSRRSVVLAGAAPAGHDPGGPFLDNAARQLEAAASRCARRRRRHGDVLALAPDAVVVATGARPYVDAALTFEGPADRRLGRARGAVPAGERPGRRLGRRPGGLDAAEVLAAAGRRARCRRVARRGRAEPPVPAEPLPAAALPRGVTILHHLELESVAGARVRLRNVFAPELIRRSRRTRSCSLSAACPRSRWPPS